MASSYTALCRFIKMATGENSATWGTNLNTLFDSLDDAIAGMATLSTTGGTYTLSTANNSDDEARNAILKVTGVLVSNSSVVVPAVSKRYTVWNATSGAFTCTVKTSGGSGIAVTQGKVMELFCDGTNVLSAITELQSPTISGATLTTPTITVADNLFTIQDNGDTARQGAFQLSGITTGNTRTLTWPDASGTIALTSDQPTAASQSDQETGTSTTAFTSPGRQHFHAGHPKAWGKLATNAATDGSYNIGSVTDVGTGKVRATYTNALSSVGSYAVICTAESSGGGTPLVPVVVAQTTTYFEVWCYNLSGVLTDPNYYHCVVLGDL